MPAFLPTPHSLRPWLTFVSWLVIGGLILGSFPAPQAIAATPPTPRILTSSTIASTNITAQNIALSSTAAADTVDVSVSQISVTGSHRADGHDVATITIALRSNSGDPVPGKQVLVVSSGSANTIVEPTSVTDASGVITATMTSTQSEAKSIRAFVVEADGSHFLSQTPVIVFTGASIKGAVFLDSNQNHALDPAEPGIGGIQISLYSSDVTLPQKQIVTGTDGSYIFTGLNAGTYRVAATLPAEYAPGNPNTVTVNVAAFQTSAGNDFGVTTSAEVHGQVWNDGNQNNVADTGEPAVGGVTIVAITGDTKSQTTVSGSDGSYHLKLPTDLPSAPDNFSFNAGSTQLREPLNAQVDNTGFNRSGYALDSAADPQNYDFETTPLTIDPVAYPQNYNFETTPLTIDPATYPQNYNFEDATLAPWDGSAFQVIRNSHDGSYAAYRPSGAAGTLTPAAFTIPANAQSLKWWWRNNYWDHTYFYLLDAETDQVLTIMYDNVGTGGNWQQYSYNVAPYLGKRVKFRLGNWDTGHEVYLDDLTLAVDAPGWTIDGNMSGTQVVHIANNSYDGSQMLYRPSGAAGTLTSAAFTIPANAQSLKWWWRNNYWDHTYFYLLDAETDQVLTIMYDNVGTGGNWQQYSYNVAPYLGKRVKFRLGNWDTGHEVYLDDVIVTPYPTTNYNLTALNPANYTSTTPNSVAVEVYGGKQHNVDFGIFAVDRYHSSMEIAPTTLVADGEATATITATLRDNAGNPLSGRAIDILAPGTAITITTPLPPTDVLGQTRGTILATHAQQVLVSARTISDNVTLADAIPITFTAGLPSMERSQFEVSPTTVVANGRNSARFVLVLRDQFANPVSGKAVTVSADGMGVDVTQDSQQTDSSGAITGSVRTTQAQVVTLHAYDTTDQIIGPQAVVNFTSTDPQQSSVRAVPATLVADGSSPVTVTVTLRDQNGEALPDKLVALQVLGGETFINGHRLDGSEIIGQSGLDGSATAILTTTLVGPRTVVAIGDNIQLNQQARIDFTFGPVDPVASQLAADKTTLIADGVTATTLTATLRDHFGHPVTDKAVRIRATGDVTLTQPGTLTDSSGRVEATLRSTTVQTVTVTVVDEHDDPIVSQEVQLAFVAGPTDPAHSNVVVTPISLLADGKQTATITASLRDTLDHPLANRNVLLIVSGSDNTITPGVQSATDSSGTVTFHLTSTRGEQKSIAVVNYSCQVSTFTV